MSAYPTSPPPYGMTIPPAQIIIQPTMLGPESTAIVCPSCQQNIASRVEHEATAKTHLFALLLCLLFCPCAILPYCMDSCQSTNHYCPKCNAYLGAYNN